MIHLIEYPKAESRTGIPADWERFKGNNHEYLPASRSRWGGSIDFGSHFGNPLSDRLWQDLVHRLMVCQMRIYDEEHPMRWTDSVPNIVRITFRGGVVENIEYTP